ncbi:PKD domain-containing protein [Tahibacter amnicola]|uniref:PKD domain-containing protein n=1 Tax=Tahibacter amnicola TaxID=2976241 RepID=A0ABY6BJK2_9GAMM|nr:PKD domain-containing protein [Tahibacter amnicola]UXI70191.1 PKD domain-containing protein [Tahibacter amnicola]
MSRWRFFGREWCVAIALLALSLSTGWAQPVISGISASPAPPLVVTQPAQLTASASVAGGDALEYRWDFGDGTPRTPWLPTNTISHTYAGAGTFTVLLQVRHPTQGLASASKPLVVRLASAPAARPSSPVVVHTVRREVWTVNPDHGTVSVVHADTLVRLDEVTVGSHPASLAIDAAGNVWVAVRDADTLRRIDPATRTVTATIALGYGAKPVAVTIAPDGIAGYVALAGPGRIQRFTPASAQLAGTLSVDTDVDALLVSGDNSRLFASRLVSRGNAGTLWRISLPAFSSATAIDLPLDTTSPDSGTAARGLPNYVGALALAEDGQHLWYGAKKDNIVAGLYREGLPLTFESVMRSLLGRVDANAGTETVAARHDIDDSGRLSALLLPPGSSHLFVAQETNNRVLVLDPWNRREITRFAVDRAPQGLSYDASTGRLFVHNFLGRSISVFDTGDLLEDGQTLPQSLGTVATTLAETLSPQVLQGKRVFYNASDERMSHDGYSTCASCHLDGRSDGRVWDFTQLGEGLRNTTSLRGNAGLGRGLVHWSGNFDEIQDFEVPIRNLFGGLGFMSNTDYFADGRNHPLGPPKAGFSADLDALAAYVASLTQDDRSPHRNPDGSLTADGSAGRAVFMQLQCGRCHAGDAFTDSPQGFRHDVGTLMPGSGQRLGGPLLAIDTPTLRGLFASAPYLHDGSAGTLTDVLTTRNPNGAHGDTASLSALQRQQLEAFLLQIDASEPGVAAPAQLAVTSPAAGNQYLAGAPVPLSIASNLAAITHVDYLVGGSAVAAAETAPWNATWIASGGGTRLVQAFVTHELGRFRTLSPPVSIIVDNDAIFRNGFDG